MSWLNYHHLMYFKTIANEGSISKASEKLLVGQPALSAQLRQLEEYFGQQLFERKNRKLILTDAGKAALKYANQISSLGVELQEVLKDKSYAIRPHLNLGSLDSIPKNLIVKLIAFARKTIDCQVTAIDATPDELYRMLISHSLDVVISNHHLVGSEDKTIFSRSIGKFPIGVYGAAKFAKLKKGFPQSLRGQPMILPTTHSKLRHDVEHYLEENKIHGHIIVDAQDTAVQKLLASDGVGLICEPEFAVRRLIRDKKISQIGMMKGVFEEFFLISTKRVVDNPVATELMQSFSFGKKR